jgi:hypothetical protein
MTTLEICLIIAVVYLVIMEVFNFIATKDTVLDAEDLICNLFWIVILPYVIIIAIYRRIKYKEK